MNTLQSSYKIYNFTLTVSSIAVIMSVVLDNHDRPVLACVQSNWLCATFVESHPMLVCSIFIREFLDESSNRNFFRFPLILIKILSLALNIFHLVVLLLRMK